MLMFILTITKWPPHSPLCSHDKGWPCLPEGTATHPLPPWAFIHSSEAQSTWALTTHPEGMNELPGASRTFQLPR